MLGFVLNPKAVVYLRNEYQPEITEFLAALLIAQTLPHIWTNPIMETKKEIVLDKKETKKIFLIIFIPLISTFIIEHFGDFNYQGYGGKISEVRVISATFTTPFGNTVITDGKGMGYVMQKDASFKVNGTYLGQLPFYIKGFFRDIIYPLILIVLLLAIYFFGKKYSIKII